MSRCLTDLVSYFPYQHVTATGSIVHLLHFEVVRSGLGIYRGSGVYGADSTSFRMGISLTGSGSGRAVFLFHHVQGFAATSLGFYIDDTLSSGVTGTLPGFAFFALLIALAALTCMVSVTSYPRY